MMRSSPTALPLLLAALLGPTAGAQGPATGAQATFTRDIAPIIFNSCTRCHRPGEAGPFPLMTYGDLRKRGAMIERVTESRFMPPWHPVEGHGEFAGANRLSDEEIALIGGWLRSGMPQGDPAELPEMPEFDDGWKLGEPDVVVMMPEGYEVPAGGPDIYRNFHVPLGLPEDKWLTAIEVRPGARTVLHHVLFRLDSTGDAQRAEGRDGHPRLLRRRRGREAGHEHRGPWGLGNRRTTPQASRRSGPGGASGF